uniref:Uncharacterized protein n=1 Tax=Chromera velia CCMP2878 TaxID=1169474 RepID=A0A0G4HN35_9ALVE|eukprot:Cvel_7590.t1-p1 / transcript=Cvel_7590.t1 / gene=Cvel_7590 / organism=Chromera_velia_CCMP2878 / gene_product=hypothetical protein / transcript_product=hypothetical protein / location=Cvel_scaffold400:507-1082(-) / protein_length=192 / sequence_SO=supercontig / SO=protein_coding / is_pseudo=false
MATGAETLGLIALWNLVQVLVTASDATEKVKACCGAAGWWFGSVGREAVEARRDGVAAASRHSMSDLLEVLLRAVLLLQRYGRVAFRRSGVALVRSVVRAEQAFLRVREEEANLPHIDALPEFEDLERALSALRHATSDLRVETQTFHLSVEEERKELKTKLGEVALGPVSDFPCTVDDECESTSLDFSFRL